MEKRPNLTPYAGALLIGGIFFYILRYFLGNQFLLSVSLSIMAALSTGVALAHAEAGSKRKVPWKKRFQALGAVLLPGLFILACVYSIKSDYTSETLITCAMGALAFLMAGSAERIFVKHLLTGIPADEISESKPEKSEKSAKHGKSGPEESKKPLAEPAAFAPMPSDAVLSLSDMAALKKDTVPEPAEETADAMTVLPPSP